MSTNSRLCSYRRYDATGTVIHAVRFRFIPSEHYSLGPCGHGVRDAQAHQPPLNSPEFFRWAYLTGGKPTLSRRSIGPPPMTAEAEELAFTRRPERPQPSETDRSNPAPSKVRMGRKLEPIGRGSSHCSSSAAEWSLTCRPTRTNPATAAVRCVSSQEDILANTTTTHNKPAEKRLWRLAIRHPNCLNTPR